LKDSRRSPILFVPGSCQGDGILEQSGGNIQVGLAGTYKVTLDFGHPPKYTYSLVKQ